MRPYASAALACAALAALGGASSSVAGARTPRRFVPPSAAPSSAPAADQLSAVCPPLTLPDGASCVPFRSDAGNEGPALETRWNRHRDRRGADVDYEQIPRRPERPADYSAYRYPIATSPGEKVLLSGYDLDRDDADQRRGPGLRAVGHGGVDLAAKRGAEVRAIALEHQEGDADVLLVGPLFGTSVVTRHTVREGGRLRDYVIVHGHLDGAAPGLAAGSPAREGALLGFVGDTGSEGIVHLHLETRRVRDGVDAKTLPPGKLVDPSQTVVTDPRNVLPIR